MKIYGMSHKYKYMFVFKRKIIYNVIIYISIISQKIIFEFSENINGTNVSFHQQLPHLWPSDFALKTSR